MNNIYNCPLHSQLKSEPSPRSVGKLLFTISLFLLGQIAFGQVSGIVFRDYNANGVKGVHEIGVEGVSVKATNASGTVYGPVNSSSNGSYTLSGVPNGENVRVEFTIPATVGCYNEKMLNGPSSGTNGTSVQFVVGGVSNTDFAIHNPIEHATDNPTIITTCFVAGSLLLDKTKVIFGTQVGVSDMCANC